MTNNILQKALTIKNPTSCRYDSLVGFDSKFETNADVDGWDIYDGIYLYGSWSGVLFGSSYGKSCYIGRTDPFRPIKAEKYFSFKLTIKYTAKNNPYQSLPTKAKIAWTTLNDGVWENNKSQEFDLVWSDNWKSYTINLGENQFWQGDVNNIRLFPFIDGYEDIKFAIKVIRIESMDNYSCLNTECSFYSTYSHPCKGAGSLGFITAGIGKERYTTISGVSDGIILNIDGYGQEKINLGTNINILGKDMAKVITNAVSLIDVGAYAYSFAEHLEDGRLKIVSGDFSTNSDVVSCIYRTIENNVSSETTNYMVDISINEDAGIGSENAYDIFTEIAYNNDSVDDSFEGVNGDSHNTSLWKLTDLPSKGASSGIYNGKFRYSCPQDTADTMKLKSNWELEGDFDIEVEWTISVSDYAASIMSMLEISGSSSGRLGIARQNIVDSWEHNYCVFYRDGSWGSYLRGWSYNSSKFRIVRSGNVFTFYVYETSAWRAGPTWTYTGFVGNIHPTLVVEMGDSYNAINVDFNNFKVNSGNVVWTNGTFPNKHKVRVADVEDNVIGSDISYWRSNSREAIIGITIPKVTPLIDTDITIYYSSSYTTDTIDIGSGGQAVSVVGGTASKELGFFDTNNRNISSNTQGIESASGFDYKSSRRLRGYEINNLIDGNIRSVAYFHNPNQYNLEAGRSDFVQSMSSNTSANSNNLEFYSNVPGAGITLIDATHPANDSGRINSIKVNGKKYKGLVPLVLIVRPNKSGKMRVIHEVAFPEENADYKYTVAQVTYKIDCNVLVSKGDMVGFYNFSPSGPKSSGTGIMNALMFSVNGKPEGVFDPGPPISQGVVGLSFYARSDRLQDSVEIDIDLGKRLNIDNITLHGQEFGDSFTYNVAACLDVNWQIELYGNSHTHSWYSCTYGSMSIVDHLNIAYGIEALGDGVTSLDNGQVGQTYGNNSNGVFTAGDGHSYFYVNGDAEWLHSAQDCVGYEFCGTDVCGLTTYGYDTDPISFVLYFPNDKFLDIEKSIMYFKESNNFKQFSLSYYLGQNGAYGNSEDIHFEYIPKYSYITLDGVKFMPGTGDYASLTQDIDNYLFPNPMPIVKPNYVNGVCTNWSVYQTALNIEWNVFEHVFSPINCQGFRIRTNWHKSTKMTEIELFSSFPVVPSLSDNIDVRTSIYGDYWDSLSFHYASDNSISADVVGSPRYFNILLTSQDKFEINELEFSVSESDLKLSDCSNIVISSNAPIGRYSDPQIVSVINTYDRPLNLRVDIPNDLVKEKQMLSWVKMESEESTVNAEVGPGAIIRKHEDLPLYLGEGQIANNVPCYSLKNMVVGKKCYTFENKYYWSFDKTIGSDCLVDYTNKKNGRETSLEFSIVSSRYWKVGVYKAKSYYVYGVGTINGVESFPPRCVYIQCPFNEKSGGIKTFLLPDNSIYEPTILLDDFSNDAFIDYWDYSLGTTPVTNSVTEVNGCMKFESIGKQQSVFIEKELEDSVVSFDFEMSFSFDTYALNSGATFTLHFMDSDGTSVYRLIFNNNSLTTTYVTATANVFNNYAPGVPYIVNSATAHNKSDFEGKKVVFRMRKEYNSYAILTLKTDDNIYSFFPFVLPNNNSTFHDRIKSIRVEFNSKDIPLLYGNNTFIGVHSISMKALPILSEKEFIVFEYAVNTPLNKIKLFQANGTIEAPAVLISYTNNNDYYLWSRDFILSKGLQTTNYVLDYSSCYYGSGLYALPYKAFDGNDSTYWMSGMDTYGPHWVVYDFGCENGRVISRINLKTNTTLTFPHLLVYGSNDITKGWNNKQKTLLIDTILIPENNVLRFVNYTSYRYYCFYFPLEGQIITTYAYIHEAEMCEDQSVGSVAYYPRSIAMSDNKLYVGIGKEFATVQAAIDAADIGDQIHIDPGTYGSVLLNKHVHLIGTGASPNDVIINNPLADYLAAIRTALPTVFYNNEEVFYIENIMIRNIVGGRGTVKFNGFTDSHIIVNFNKCSLIDTGTSNSEVLDMIDSSLTINLYNCYLSTPVDHIYGFNIGEINLFKCELNKTLKYLYCTESVTEIDYVTSPTPGYGINYGIDHIDYAIVRTSDTNTLLSYDNTYLSYYAIDLGDVYCLDILRNYGDNTYKLPIDNDANVLFSNTNTDSIVDVDWTNVLPSLLLHCDDYTDSSSYAHTLVPTGNVSLVQGKFSAAFSFSVNNLIGYISISNHDSFYLGSKNFTIDFNIKRLRIGKEGLLSHYGATIGQSSFSIMITPQNKVSISVFSGSGVKELISNVELTDMTSWYHVAIVRVFGSLSLYVNGALQDNTSIGTTYTINKSISSLIIGTVGSDTFKGYLDEMRLIVGDYAWDSDFVVPSKVYTIEDTISGRKDARWLRFPMLNGDNVVRYLQNIGIYPDIKVPYKRLGGFNCEWESLGTGLTNYNTVPYNTSPSSAIIYSTPHTHTWGPYNLINMEDLYGVENCWAFEDCAIPTVTFDLIEPKYIDKFVFQHAYSYDDPSTWRNTDYSVYVSPTTSGVFTKVLGVVGNTKASVTYNIDTAVLAQVVKLEITKYVKPNSPLVVHQSNNDEPIVHNGGFLRRFEIWTTANAFWANSQDNPIVCIDLKDQFSLSGHKLEKNKDSDLIPNGWDNDDVYFQYSDSSYSDPRKVVFFDSGGYDISFSFTTTYNAYGGLDTYVLGEDVFLSEGHYIINWQTYGANSYEGLSITISGPNFIEVKSANKSTSWVDQYSEIVVYTQGYYVISVNKMVDEIPTWGIRSVYFKRIYSNSRWVAVRRNTATGYSFTHVVADNEIDYLNKIKVFTDELYSPTECSWWWKSDISTLSNDPINTKIGKKSLKIDYPTSSGIDRIDFLEGDYFGNDIDFHTKDLLSFWLHVDDITAVDMDNSGVGFGSFYGEPAIMGYSAELGNHVVTPATTPAFYMWSFKDTILTNGWNEVKFKFTDFFNTSPTPNMSVRILDKSLDFRSSTMTSFGLILKGNGAPFTMLLDGIKIERNRFNDEMQPGRNGLCLTWNDVVEVPVSGLSPRIGSIEMWVKLYSDTIGMDIFGNVRSRTLFTLNSSGNDLVSLSIRSSNWFEVGFGGARYNYNFIYTNSYKNDLTDVYFSRDEVFHVALVWTNDGTGTDSGDTVVLYINGKKMMYSKTKWDVVDSKSSILRIGGGNTFLANMNDAEGSGIFNNVKVYNYCKDSFNLNPYADNYSAVDNRPNDYIEVSKDGINYLTSTSDSLPLLYEGINAGEKVEVFTRVNKSGTNKMTKHTGTIDIEWEVPV